MSQSVGTMEFRNCFRPEDFRRGDCACSLWPSFGANILLHGVSPQRAGPRFRFLFDEYFEHAHLIPMGSLCICHSAAVVILTSGLPLVLGLFSRFTLIVGALVMTALVVGTNLAQDWLVAGCSCLTFSFITIYIHLEQNTVSWTICCGWGGR